MFKGIDHVHCKEMIAAADDEVATFNIRNAPREFDSPLFDKLYAELEKALLPLTATKGLDVGSGYKGKFYHQQ